MTRGHRSRLYVVILGLLWCVLSGCSKPVGVRPMGDSEWFRRVYRSALNDPEPSERTQQFLRRRVLTDEFERKPVDVLHRLAAEFEQKPTRDTAFVLAELCYLGSRDLPLESDDAAMLATSALLYSYSYLFDDALGAAASQYDPAFRMACDLYNRSGSRLVLIGQKIEVKWNDAVPGSWLRGRVEFHRTHTCLRS